MPPSRPPRPLRIGISYRLTFSPDSLSVLVTGRRLNLWGLAARERVGTCHPLKHPSHADFLPDGTRCVLKNTSGKLAVMPISDMEAFTLLPVDRPGEGCQVLFSPCGYYLIDGCWDGRLTVRDVVSGRLALEEEAPGSMVSWIGCDAGRQLFAYARGLKAYLREDSHDATSVHVRRWPFHEHREVSIAGPWSDARAAAPSPDGKRLAILERERLSVISLDDAQGVVHREFAMTPGAYLRKVLAWSPDGTLIGCIYGDDALFLDSRTLECRARHADRDTSDVAFSPDGRFVGIGTWSKGVVMPVEQLLATPTGSVDGEAQPARPA